MKILKEIDEKTDMVKTLNQKNVNPSVTPTIYAIYTDLKGKGLTKRDVITLIQDRARPTKLTRTQIEATLEAIFKIEKQLLAHLEKE